MFLLKNIIDDDQRSWTKSSIIYIVTPSLFAFSQKFYEIISFLKLRNLAE